MLYILEATYLKFNNSFCLVFDNYQVNLAIGDQVYTLAFFDTPGEVKIRMITMLKGCLISRNVIQI